MSGLPKRVAAGASFIVDDRVRNLGGSASGRSRTGYFLSRDGEHSRMDLPLRGRRAVPKLRPRRGSRGSARVDVPATTPVGSFHVIACADLGDEIRERRSHNNCTGSDNTLEVTAPTRCLDRLSRLRVAYSRGPTKPGVADPVTVRLPLNGISYFASGEPSPRTTMFMDCSLALALHEMAETLAPLGITAIEDLGIYEYRCIAGTDPCELSQHAHATAIDLHEFRTSDGNSYNVEVDWVINPDLFATCSAPTLDAKDALLHRLVCDWDAADLFHVILTPNYNADHRNHFHVDLTPGADFIE